jgi:membrane protease YdiL (CAAX protease family)
LRLRFDLFHAAVWQQLGFTVGLAIIFAVIVIWQRACGRSLADLGWGRPTTKLALILAVALAASYLYGSYFGAHYVLRKANVLELNWVRFALIPFGIFMAIAEETMMRGFFMTELQRAGVPTWQQIFASGICSASYHSLQNLSWIGFLPACFLFSIHAGLYVLGRRSLTPTVLAHGAYHVFGEPYLLMMVLATMHK